MFPDLLEFLNYFRRDILLLLGMIVSLLFKRGREFIRHWGPFLFLWICYDMMRGIADNFGPVHVREIYDIELILFGWLFEGQIPAFWMLDYQTVFLSAFTGFIYTLHPMIPLWLGIVIFYISKDIETFKEYTYSFLLTTYLALLTFIIYPVAPPWYVASSGFTQPDRRTGIKESAAGLINLDQFFQTRFYGTVYATFNSNPFAALPSLHSAFSIISAYYFIYKYKSKSRFVYLAIIYPITVWFSAVYLQHHYIVDLIFGGIYVFISIHIVRWFRSRKDQQEIEEVIIEQSNQNSTE